MEILAQLGVNETYFLQLIIFMVTIFLLSQFVFKDYVILLQRREQQTKGSETIAHEEQQKALEISRQYEDRARALNGEIKNIFDEQRQDANKHYEKLILSARGEATKVLEETRHRLASEVGDAARKLNEQAPIVAQAMTRRLLSKDAARS